MGKRLIEGEDYYIERGKRVFTESYLLKRGKCCHHNCRNCPWRNKKLMIDKPDDGDVECEI